MGVTAKFVPEPAPVRRRGLRLWRRWLRWRWRRFGWYSAALLVIAAAAAVADAWNIAAGGLETYYAAAVRAMAGNWHDFLYGSLDPGGLLSLDKLPGPFWVQALSVRAFGLSAWAMVLPQVIWSVLTVIVLFFTVKRSAGPVAGLVAAGLLAVSPVTIMAAHGNVGDPLFVLLCVLAADAVLRAMTSGGLRWLVLAAVWAGLAFQVKMTEAWLAAAVLGVAYLVAGPPAGGRGFAGGTRGFAAGAGRRAARLAVAAPVLAAVSLAWMVFVALTPAGDRPYADGSRHDSVFAQVFDYNGIARFGTAPSYGLGYLVRPSAAALAWTRRAQAVFTSAGSQTRPGWDRLATAPLAQVTGWLLLPAVVVAAVAVVAVCRARGQEARRAHAPVFLWGLLLIVLLVVFSASHDVQSYYFAIVSPVAAALCALGAKGVLDAFDGLPVRVRARARHVALAAGVTMAALASAGIVAEAGPAWHGLAIAAGAAALAAGAGAVGLALAAGGRSGTRARRALVLALTLTAAAAGLAGPVAADGWVLARHAGPFDVPLASGGTLARPSPSLAAARHRYRSYGGTLLPETTPALWRRFQQIGREDNALAPPGKWLAVYSGAEAGNYLLGGTRRVLPIGGFTGSLPVPTAARLSGLLAGKFITEAVVPGPDDPRFTDPRVQTIIRDCKQISRSGDRSAAERVYDCRNAR